MSIDKIKKQRRIKNDNKKIKKQTNIFKNKTGKNIKELGRLKKKHALSCSKPGCLLCSNPRKTLKELTIQERKFKDKFSDY